MVGIADLSNRATYLTTLGNFLKNNFKIEIGELEKLSGVSPIQFIDWFTEARNDHQTGLSMKKEENEHELPLQWQQKYEEYLQNPQIFEQDIVATVREVLTHRQPDNSYPLNVSAVVNFALAIKNNDVIDHIKNLAIIAGYVDTMPLSRAIKSATKAPNAEDWLNGIVKSRFRMSAGTGKSDAEVLTKLKSDIRHYMQIPYETLLYAYVFAKAQGKEKSFVNSFPTETHCSGSLVDPVRTWLDAEKTSLKMPTEEALEYKLNRNIEELLQSNAFIKARIGIIVERWLYLEWYKYYRNMGTRAMPIEQVEAARPQDEVEDIGLTDTMFAKSIYNRIETHAKIRVAQLWNQYKDLDAAKRSQVVRGGYGFLKTSTSSGRLCTIDYTMHIHFTVKQDEESISPTTENDITITSIEVSDAYRNQYGSLQHQPLSDYLKSQYAVYTHH